MHLYFLKYLFSVLLGIHLGIEFWGEMVIYEQLLRHYQIVFYADEPLHISTSKCKSTGVSFSPHPCQHLSFSVLVSLFFVLAILVDVKHKWLLFMRPFLVFPRGKRPFKVKGNQANLILPAILGGKEISKDIVPRRTQRGGVFLELKALIAWPGPMIFPG